MEQALGAVLLEKPSGIHCVGPRTRVAEAAELMRANEVGSVLVLEHGRLVGIFTERDLMARVVCAGLMPAIVRIQQVMTPEPYTVMPSMTVEDALAFCTRHRIRHLPVCTAERVLGVVSLGDLVRSLVQRRRHRSGDLMRYIYGSRA